MLLVINGAPGVGKTTVGRRYCETDPGATLIDIDAIRADLAGWSRSVTSGQDARDLAVANVQRHLVDGQTVVIPQYIGRPGFLAQLHGIAARCESPFCEALLVADVEATIERFLRRRRDNEKSGVVHPEADIAELEVETRLRSIVVSLERDARQRGATIVVNHAVDQTVDEIVAICNDARKR